MLTKDDVILGQLITEGLPQDLLIQPSGILAGLNEVSYSVSPYSTNNFVEQVEEVTGSLTPHSEVFELGTTEMAKVIRGAFDMIKTYGVPMALSIADGVSCLYSQESVRRTVRGELDIKYINVDDPLFNFNIYPVANQIKIKGSTFSSVNFDMLKRLRFDYMDDSQWNEWLNSKHPEIVAIMDDKSFSTSGAFYALNDIDGMSNVFNVEGENTFNFTTIKGIDMVKLMKMFVISSKMMMDDKPIPCLSEGSLEDYRAFVDLIWNGLCHYLIQLKEFVKMYRAREIVVVDMSPIRYKEITPHEALGVRVKVIEGKVLVYYTEAIMKTITASETAISDVVVAYLYSRVANESVSLKELADDKIKVNILIDSYIKEVSGLITHAAQKVFYESAIRAIAKFIEEHPAAKEALYQALGEKGSLVPTIVRERLGSAINNLYLHYDRIMAIDSSDDFEGSIVGDDLSLVGERKKRCIEIILSTDIVPTFLKLLGCDMAAAIISATYVAQDKAFTAVDEREQLHCALIKVLSDLSLG